MAQQITNDWWSLEKTGVICTLDLMREVCETGTGTVLGGRKVADSVAIDVDVPRAPVEHREEIPAGRYRQPGDVIHLIVAGLLLIVAFVARVA